MNDNPIKTIFIILLLYINYPIIIHYNSLFNEVIINFVAFPGSSNLIKNVVIYISQKTLRLCDSGIFSHFLSSKFIY